MTYDNSVPLPPVLRLGERHPLLPVIRGQLQRAGFPLADAVDDQVFDHQFHSVLRQFQQARGVIADGVLGQETLWHIEHSRYRLGDRVLRFDPVRPLLGDDVAELQRRMSQLGIFPHRVDGIFASETDAGVRELQGDLGLSPDGVFGPRTHRGLHMISKDVGGGNLFALRERSRVQRSGSSLAGKTIVLEADTLVLGAAHDPDSASHDVARRLERRFSAVGTSAIVRDQTQRGPTYADEIGADLVISIDTDRHASEAANGLASFYYGSRPDAADVSPIGASLADVIHREILARTDLRDNRVHPRTWESLRMLRTPKVHVLMGYETNPHDSRRLASPDFRDTIAEAVLVGVQRVYLPDQDEPTTGVMRVDQIMSRRPSS